MRNEEAFRFIQEKFTTDFVTCLTRLIENTFESRKLRGINEKVARNAMKDARCKGVKDTITKLLRSPGDVNATMEKLHIYIETTLLPKTRAKFLDELDQIVSLQLRRLQETLQRNSKLRRRDRISLFDQFKRFVLALQMQHSHEKRSKACKVIDGLIQRARDHQGKAHLPGSVHLDIAPHLEL